MLEVHCDVHLIIVVALLRVMPPSSWPDEGDWVCLDLWIYVLSVGHIDFTQFEDKISLHLKCTGVIWMFYLTEAPFFPFYH